MDIKDPDFQKDWVLPELKDKVTTLEREKPLPIHKDKMWLPLNGLGGAPHLYLSRENIKPSGWAASRLPRGFLKQALLYLSPKS